jgi:hypothetical protein
MTFSFLPLDGSLPAKTIFATIILVVILQRVFVKYVGGKKYKFPPRVPGLPVVGNTFQIPPGAGGLWGSEQAKKYGEM